jgi:cytochrome c oxidase subunit 2
MSGVLDAAGPQAAHIAALWRVTLWTCVVVFALVMAMLAWAVARAPRGDAETSPDVAPEPGAEKRMRTGVATGAVVAGVLLLGLLVASVMTDRALAQLRLADALTIHVTAHQWWWEIVYDDASPERMFSTANELHVPVGRPVVVTLDADDVIHSFWVPSLHGKKDLIPGRTSTLTFQADRPGVFPGRCAEYCGLEHAIMGFDVVATEPERFAAWAEAQRRPAAEPRDEAAARGRELFLSGSCMLCHAIRGTTAGARKAPDLTHVASRMHLAAGGLANTPQALAAWIANPGAIKPGVNMPAHLLPGEDLAALVAYIETLK